MKLLLPNTQQIDALVMIKISVFIEFLPRQT